MSIFRYNLQELFHITVYINNKYNALVQSTFFLTSYFIKNKFHPIQCNAFKLFIKTCQ